ncbi:PH domain-containing protein [Sediminibacillus albus]|nr:PH domain-containing protein [Sediminibacillus albus]
MSEPRRMHPATTIFNFIRLIKDFIIPLLIGSFAFVRNISASSWIWMLAAALIVAGMIAFSFLSWYRFTYRVEEEELRIEYGLLIRKKRYISKNRIQSIDLTAGIIHRLFGLVRVEVQTAGSDNAAEAGLKAVTRNDGEQLRDILKGLKDTTGEPQEGMNQVQSPEHPDVPAEKIKFPRLLFAATTSGGIGVFLSLFALVGSQFNQMVPEGFLKGIYNWAVHLSIMVIIVLVLIICLVLWLMAIAGTFLRYSYFTIYKREDEIFITRGLLEKKQVTIPLKRIQGIRIQENIFRQPFGYAAVYAEVAGGAADKNDDFSIALFPLLKTSEIPGFIGQFLPDFQYEQNWRGLPRRSARRFILRAAAPVLLVAIPLIYFFPMYSWTALIVLAAASALGFLRYKDAGFAVQRNQLYFRNRGLSRETIVTKKNRIQSMSSSEHWFQWRKSLKTSYFSIASHSGLGKRFRVKDMEAAEADELHGWYSFQEK